MDWGYVIEHWYIITLGIFSCLWVLLFGLNFLRIRRLSQNRWPEQSNTYPSVVEHRVTLNVRINPEDRDLYFKEPFGTFGKTRR